MPINLYHTTHPSSCLEQLLPIEQLSPERTAFVLIRAHSRGECIVWIQHPHCTTPVRHISKRTSSNPHILVFVTPAATSERAQQYFRHRNIELYYTLKDYSVFISSWVRRPAPRSSTALWPHQPCLWFGAIEIRHHTSISFSTCSWTPSFPLNLY